MGHRILYIPKIGDVVKYGLLYNYYAIAGTGDNAISSSNDWTIPTGAQLSSFQTYLGGASVSGGKLKETGYVYWNNPNTGATNEYGFNARGSGARTSIGTFSGILQSVHYWGQAYNLSLAWFIIAYYDSASTLVNVTTKVAGYSVQLVKDATGISDGVTTTYTGNDGKEYTAVAINELYWLQQHLAETRFRNGDIIPWYGASQANYFTDSEWAALTTAGCCAYDNDEGNVAAGFSFPT